ncbi:biotin--[acetyl-CoA-carboxylase] ligase [Massilia sp. W12]|uniref:biotin--[acetyl-CoA-carboxylase] ligase n=1 Tax=Massilia sp. W12 TaxID=3126507 RepID=UPI0030CF748B
MQQDDRPSTDSASAFEAQLRASMIELSPTCPELAQLAIEVAERTGSTNGDLLARCQQLRQNTLRLALRQEAGRGRGGRPWLSAPGHSLTFSLAWHFEQPLHALLGLPLACGWALTHALQTLGVPAQLKWPNDILKDGRKLAGLLVETAAAAHGGFWAVIGIGLNLSLPEELEAQIGQPAADARWLAQMPAPRVLASLLPDLLQALQEFSRHGLTPFAPRWNALHAYAGQQVMILDQGQLLHSGRALGIDETGRLLLQDDAGAIQQILAGDVSLRPAKPGAAA